MAISSDDLVAWRDALKGAMASGTTVVMYNGKRVEYRSFKEQIQTLAWLEDQIAGTSGPRASRSTLASFSKG